MTLTPPAAWIRAAFAAIVALSLLGTADVAALKLALSPSDIARGLSLARRPDAERARFHAPYIFAVADATFWQVEVITEFRRCVLLGEERLSQGDWIFTHGGRGADEALRPWRGRVTIAAHLRFHPHNTFASVPPYGIAVSGTEAGVPIAALETSTKPLTSLPSPDGSSSLVGAVIESQFAASMIGQTRRLVSVTLDRKLVAQTMIDFARLE